MMTKNVAIALGFSVGAAIIGGVSLKFMKGRKDAVKETAPKSLKVLVQEAVAQKKYDEWTSSLGEDELRDMHVVSESISKVENCDASPTTDVIENVVIAPVLSLAKETVKEAVPVSRIRVQIAPVFWTHFESNIKRLEIIQLDEKAFSDRSKLEYNRGWHKCVMNGMNGILHVTKSNISAVVFDNGEFHGISTSVARFGGSGMMNLTHDRIKAYLQGH